MCSTDVGKLHKFRCKWAKQYNDRIAANVSLREKKTNASIASGQIFFLIIFAVYFFAFISLWGFFCDVLLASNLLFIWCNGSITTDHFFSLSPFFFPQSKFTNSFVSIFFSFVRHYELWLLFLLNLFEWKTFKYNHMYSNCIRICCSKQLFQMLHWVHQMYVVCQKKAWKKKRKHFNYLN